MSGTMDLNVIPLGFGDKGKAPSCGKGWKDPANTWILFPPRDVRPPLGTLQVFHGDMLSSAVTKYMWTRKFQSRCKRVHSAPACSRSPRKTTAENFSKTGVVRGWKPCLPGPHYGGSGA